MCAVSTVGPDPVFPVFYFCLGFSLSPERPQGVAAGVGCLHFGGLLGSYM